MIALASIQPARWCRPCARVPGERPSPVDLTQPGASRAVFTTWQCSLTAARKHGHDRPKVTFKLSREAIPAGGCFAKFVEKHREAGYEHAETAGSRKSAGISAKARTR